MNPFQVVAEFEEAMAEYAGSKYAVAVDSCSNALFLCCLHLKVGGKVVTIPKRTYPSVPCAIINAGGKVAWDDGDWSGVYQLKPFPIIDGAKRFRRNMYIPGSYHCLSFHTKKQLPIGRGGMILTDDEQSWRTLKLMRFNGRDECSLAEQEDFAVIGWNFYMTPEQAIRGLCLLGVALDSYEDLPETPPYPDLSKFPVYNNG